MLTANITFLVSKKVTKKADRHFQFLMTPLSNTTMLVAIAKAVAPLSNCCFDDSIIRNFQSLKKCHELMFEIGARSTCDGEYNVNS